jgi:hypothetical protein
MPAQLQATTALLLPNLLLLLLLLLLLWKCSRSTGPGCSTLQWLC